MNEEGLGKKIIGALLCVLAGVLLAVGISLKRKEIHRSRYDNSTDRDRERSSDRVRRSGERVEDSRERLERIRCIIAAARDRSSAS